MKPNQIKKIKFKNGYYILIINSNEYSIDEYYYQHLLPYEGKVLEVSYMLELIAFSSASKILKKTYKKIFNHSICTYELKSILRKNEIIEGCPAWESSNPPEFLKMLSDTFNELFNTSPEIKYIHAGLECGLFGSVKPDIPIISFGPTIRFPHSPSEELELATLKDFYIFLANILQKLLKK